LRLGWQPGITGAACLSRVVNQYPPTMRSFSYLVGLSLALVWLFGCAQPQTRQAWSSADSWFRPPSDWSRFRQAQSLPEADIAEVAPDGMAAAEEPLRDVACVEISAERASELAGRPIPPRGGSTLFLVRAVYLNRGNGKFIERVKPLSLSFVPIWLDHLILVLAT
jgi:hypothetical protein